ncbi:efflux transporter periplasmic adaptor subunit [Halovibrio salipaludis]|uniref:Efflux transporter periplasmic adaptor subunit n=1 Tax=Halovibrio salipaludis TaxID=2032626 RepID=A0A2A2FA33_9GAMM|nr:efflux RND transporter periplasmic adaptor subunit [Halovibrio salipaludis]PAU82296.1 efflux transporter periplasmic adaptor subunit [Halovibrio salipaludis]
MNQLTRTDVRGSSRARRIGGLSTALVLTLGLTACGGSGDGGQGQKGGGTPPPPVSVTEVQTEDVTIREDYAGRVRGAREVAVRARVEGVLEERLYDEGKVVKQGQPLFRIDPEPFEVALQAAEAQLQSARADLNQAEREWNRVSSLYEKNAVSERERDNAQSAFELAQAQVAVAEAEVERAELELGYTDVEAPVTGVTGLETQSEGNLIERGTELTHITQMNPVHVRFALPENDAAARRRAREAMQSGSNGDHRSTAKLILPDGSEYEHTGTIDFTASTIDPETGTVTARAVFPNKEQRIVPGQFVRIRVKLNTLEDVMTVPAKAVSDGGNGGLQVFVLDDDNKAQPRSVETGQVVDGRRIITDGLEAGERVVVGGMAGIRQPGMKVKVENGQKGQNGGESN